jgi:hypothetical protein
MRGHGRWTIEIVKRSDTAKVFVVLPRRWVVERTFAWLGRCRRLAKDWEKSIKSATAFAHIASIRMLKHEAVGMTCDGMTETTQLPVRRQENAGSRLVHPTKNEF